MPLSFQLSGLQQLVDKFNSYPNDVKQGLDDELTATAYATMTDAKTLAPADVGTLRNSIDVVRNEPLLKQVSAQAEYSAYVEFGTGGFVNVLSGLEEFAIQFKGAGIRKINLHARPYFFPALFRNTAQLEQRLKTMMEEQAVKK